MLPSPTPENTISQFLQLIGQPVRIQILLVIGSQESCVCHLEAALGVRQASISQHLMALRKVGLVSTRRDGRYIYYGLNKPEVAGMLQQAAALAGVTPEFIQRLSQRNVPGCPCPHCNPGASGSCE